MSKTSAGKTRSNGRSPSARKSKNSRPTGSDKSSPKGTPRTTPSGHRRSFDVEVQVLLACCREVSTPRSLAVSLLAQAGEWDQYLALPAPDKESSSFADDYLVSEMLTKHPALPVKEQNPQQRAIDTWYAAEAQCAATNTWIDSYLNGLCSIPPGMERKIERMRQVIADLIGPLDRQRLQRIEEGFRYGPGATSASAGRFVLPSRKRTSSIDVTPKLYPYWKSLVTHIGAAESASADGECANTIKRPLQKEVRLIASNRVIFVPKNAKTHRAIGIENSGNIYAQFGVASVLRDGLRRCGIDLRTQKLRNRVRVSRAHVNGDATVDLRTASDTTAARLIDLVFDPKWAYLLDVLRSEWSRIEGREVRLEKFSSMGNGYTFELETLIFYSACAACGEWGADVFGDDIIVSQARAPEVIELLEFIGYTVNKEKTFLAGTFFESCGVDYSRGHNVRPFYLKGKYESFDVACVRICNKIRLYAHRRCNSVACDSRFLPAWLRAYRASDLARRTGIPVGVGDNGIIRNFDEASPTPARASGKGWEGYFGRLIPTKGRLSRYTDELGAYASSLDSGSVINRWDTLQFNAFERGRENIRGSSVAARTIGSILVREWTDLGPWI